MQNAKNHQIKKDDYIKARINIVDLLKKAKLLFEIPSVLVWSRLLFCFFLKRSTLIFWLTKAFANDKAVSPFPSIQTVIIFLMLTIKIRWYKVIKLIHFYEY